MAKRKSHSTGVQNTQKHSRAEEHNRAQNSFNAGYGMVTDSAIFQPINYYVYRKDERRCAKNGLAVISSQGMLYASIHPFMPPADWAYAIAHCLLHLGMGHFAEKKSHPAEWNAACDLIVARFLSELKVFGPPLWGLPVPDIGAGQTEQTLYERFCHEGIPAHLKGYGVAGTGHPDMIWESDKRYFDGKEPNWSHLFGAGLREALVEAVDYVGGVSSYHHRNQTAAERAKAWFVNNYPLLGALAVSFDVIEDPALCQRLDISVAAVDAEAQEIYINPGAGLDEKEYLFVMAHELLHVGLRHHARREGRDPLLWNIACDYVINGWLIEMGIGVMPRIGALYDPQFKNESAESIYDRIIEDVRGFQRMATLRGKGLGDILEPKSAAWWAHGEGLTLDEFYRRCLAEGLDYHCNLNARGFLPAGLVEEIRALSQPPIPWDVELAQWFDHYFPAVEKVRSYARASRRQSSTPDIPRPRSVIRPDSEDARTFGVVLDTSGSMDSRLLAKALGAIASYSTARDVPAARVVFCDAVAYDAGYMPPDAIADRVQVKGRGGTILQPGIDLLEHAKDFPVSGPILIITDGYCDVLRIRRDHAFLMPGGHGLPFRPRGPVFTIRHKVEDD